MNKAKFSTLQLPQNLLSNLDSLGYTSMTAIQAESLPAVLDGRDVIAQAKTGSGKTAAFGLGLLTNINPRWFAIQALVLCPTRELADQVAQEIRRLARCIDNIKVITLCGGTPMARGTLELAGVKTLVLDEADRMVDMGFIEEIVGIVRACPRSRQTLMFSATYPDNIRKLAEQFMKQPHMVKVEALHDAGQIEQWWYEIDPDQRLDIVARVLHSVRPTSALAFCNTKQRCKELVAELQQAGFSAEALYGELEQRDRDQILARFAGKTITALVATDVAARGLDIKDLDLVINVDVAHDPEVHIHRIGRTGRGDKHGLALTLVSPSDARRAASIEEYQKADLAWEELADLKPAPGGPLQPPMVMLEIAGGKREKLRPGDILGALTGEGGVDGKQVGKITVFEFNTFVALDRHIAQQAFERLSAGKIKAKSYKMRFVE